MHPLPLSHLSGALFVVASVLAGCLVPTEETPANECPAVDQSLVVNHPGGTLGADETWGPADGRIEVGNDLTIAAGATLTIEPCTVVAIGPGKYITVDGALVARGSATLPITIKSSEAGSRFRSLIVNADAQADLAHVDVSGGGDLPGQTYGATIEVVGNTLPISRPLKVDHVKVHDSAGYGIHLRKWAGFADGSTDLTITDCGKADPDHPFALRISLNAMHTIPGGAYVGNGQDAIQLFSESPHYKVEVDDVLHDRGVPYQVGGNGGFGIIEVDGGSTLATLTIEPGVVVQFSGDGSNIGGMFVGNTGTSGATGRLIAVGTVAAPIVLTGPGASPAAGSWEGVTFEGPFDPGNLMQHVRIEAAGAHGGDSSFGCPPPGSPYDATGTDGALKLFTEPSGQFFTDSAIVDSSTYGVFRAWSGGAVDFLATNTFTGVALCKQVEPKSSTGTCPANPSCP